MKKLLSIALLLCLSFSLFSFAPARQPPPVAKQNVASVTFPITGQTGSKLGTLDYVIDGSSNVPSSITFYLAGTSTQVISRPFTVYPSSANTWIADDLKTTTGITAVLYHSISSWPEYAIEIISPY
ncbi:hypothetical protein [Chitinophaga sp. CF418]|uniref:hypothetical protein n=1 Tax=Chitinophaga sp. CF418 TaxID=1855287 RepID=UPI0009176AF0|nr:hypothetical protein [Chitinophaga sp. CF418]SHN38590.1 hypothetical protein SAMN05216311_11119 [Chitinophaga sp. CF418]